MSSLSMVILIAGVPDQNGVVYSRETLEAMAAKSDDLSLDGDGRLWRNFVDSKTQEFADYLKDAGASPEMAGNFALENFANILKERKKRGLPGCYPKDSGATGPQSGWIPVQRVEEEE